MMILTGGGGKFAALCALSLFLAAMGAVICIVIQNYFMLPVLAVGMGLIPFWYVLFTSHSYKKLMNNEIETGLSIITSSYLRSESIITAVEENIHYLNPPVADVFRGFLAETGMISADVKQALSNMKPKLDNYIFREWVDAAIACQDDKSLKSTLTPIIGKLSDMRIVAAELDYLMYEPFQGVHHNGLPAGGQHSFALLPEQRLVRCVGEHRLRQGYFGGLPAGAAHFLCGGHPADKAGGVQKGKWNYLL